MLTWKSVMLVKAVNKPRHSGPSALATLTSSRACAGRYVARGIMPKRKHWTPGNYIEIPLSGNRFCYGVVTITERLAIMDYCNTEKLSPEQVAELPILFELVVMNYAIGKNGWPLAGQVEYLDKFKNFPLNFKQDKINGKYYILDHTWANSTLATEEECVGLERASAWDPCHIIDRLNEHYRLH